MALLRTCVRLFGPIYAQPVPGKFVQLYQWFIWNALGAIRIAAGNLTGQEGKILPLVPRFILFGVEG